MKQAAAIFETAQRQEQKPVLSDAVTAFFFENRTRQCMVYGHSMEPFLTYGENVTIVPCGPRLKKARCYAFVSGNSLTIHRFIRNHGTGIALFAGDNSHFLDRVPLSSVVGELSACQSPVTLIIIQCINDIFSMLMMLFHDVVLIGRSRRCLVRSLITLTKKG